MRAWLVAGLHTKLNWLTPLHMWLEVVYSSYLLTLHNKVGFASPLPKCCLYAAYRDELLGSLFRRKWCSVILSCLCHGFAHKRLGVCLSLSYFFFHLSSLLSAFTFFPLYGILLLFIKKRMCVCKCKYNSVLKENAIKCARKWINLEYVILSEVKQAQR